MADAGTSTHGIDWIAVGILDDNGDIITGPNGVCATGVLKIDGDGEGFTTSNITTIEEKGEIKFANNKPKRVSHGKSHPEIALTALDMPRSVLMKLRGFVKSGTSGYVLRSGNKPNVAILVKSSDLDDTAIYEGFANGELIQGTNNHGTDNTKEVEADTTISYQALTPIADNVFVDDKGVKQPYKNWAETDDGFKSSEMLAEIFHGYSGPDVDKLPVKVTDDTNGGNTPSNIH